MNTVLRKWHDLTHPYWWIVPVSPKIQKQIRRALFFYRSIYRTIKIQSKWGCVCPGENFTQRHGFICRNRDRIILWKWNCSYINVSNVKRNGKPTTKYAYANRHYYGIQLLKWLTETKKHNSYQHDVNWKNDRTKQKQLMIYWRPGKVNLGDYLTKNNPPAHHWLVCPIYLNGVLPL